MNVFLYMLAEVSRADINKQLVSDCLHSATISIRFNASGNLDCIFHLPSMTPAAVQKYFGKGVFEVEEAFSFCVEHIDGRQEKTYLVVPGQYPVAFENNAIVIEFKRSKHPD